MREVVVFDFDGTLAKGDSFLQFARHSLSPWKIALATIKAAPSLIGWKLGLTNNSRAKETLFGALYGGVSAKRLQQKAETFNPKFDSRILSRLLEHKKQGHTVYIISASLDLWMEKIANQLGVGLCCTETATDSRGRVCRHFASPNCYGQEKLVRLLKAEPMRKSYFLTVYGDSDGDSALLEEADRGIDLRSCRN